MGITAVGENARQLPAGRQVVTITGMPQFKKDIIKELLGIWIVSIIILSCEHVPIIITGLVIAMARSPMKIRSVWAAVGEIPGGTEEMKGEL